MKFRNYKQLLEKTCEGKQTILTISLWSYSSKRMVFKVPFDQIKKYLDGDMLFKYYDYKLKFTTVYNKKHCFQMYKLKIAKVDYVEIV